MSGSSPQLPVFFIYPPVNSLQIFLLGERGSGHDSGEKFKSRVKRAGGMIFRIHYKKEKFLDSEKAREKCWKKATKNIKNGMI